MTWSGAASVGDHASAGSSTDPPPAPVAEEMLAERKVKRDRMKAAQLEAKRLMADARSPAHRFSHRVYNPLCKHCVAGRLQLRRRTKGILKL